MGFESPILITLTAIATLMIAGCSSAPTNPTAENNPDKVISRSNDLSVLVEKGGLAAQAPLTTSTHKSTHKSIQRSIASVTTSPSPTIPKHQIVTILDPATLYWIGTRSVPGALRFEFNKSKFCSRGPTSITDFREI